jgi:hypothetical protein
MHSPIQSNPAHTLEIGRADQNGPIRFCFAGKIFPARLLLDGLTVCSKHFQFVLIVPMDEVVQGLSADPAPNANVSILAPESHDTAVKNITFFSRRKLQFTKGGVLLPRHHFAFPRPSAA